MFGIPKTEGNHDLKAKEKLQPEVDTTEQSGKLCTLPVAACGAGLFSDGYINNVG
jgi:hypothetical protein